jgi:hypothetical protein
VNDIKNVILYDNWGHVVGFVELKNAGTVTEIRAKHNLTEEGLITSVNGAVVEFAPDAVSGQIARVPALSLSAEITICIMSKSGKNLSTLAGGIINPNPAAIPAETPAEIPTLDAAPTPPAEPIAADCLSVKSNPLSEILADTAESPISRATPKFVSNAAREIDEVLRAVCQIDETKKGICESCPYRDYFFGEGAITANLSAPKIALDFRK